MHAVVCCGQWARFPAWGQFKDGQAGGVKILHGRGGDSTIVNPWPCKSIRNTDAGQPAEIAPGDRFPLKTGTGERLALEPQ